MNEVSKNRHRVLVVDDDASVCRLLEEALEAEGYAAESCLHPEEALALCRARSFGLIFVDIRLPGMSGFDLASRIKEEYPEREVVFITGFGSFDSVLRAIKVGAYDYLRKPFNLSELNLCLRRYQERRELKDRIQSAERRYFDLVQNIPMMIWVLRKGLGLEFVNEACEPLLGYAPEEARAEPGWFLDRVHPEDRLQVRGLLLSAFEARGAPFSTQCRLLHRKGRQIHVLLKSLPQEEPAEGGVRDRLEGVVVDITDRVVLEKAMVQREKLKTLGAVSAEVAHEIRNPLVSIGGFARRLQQRQPDLLEGEIILNESRRLEGILDRIQDYLKPVDVEPRTCSVNDVVRSTMEYLVHDFERGRADFVLELDEALPAIRTDPDVLVEVLTSLARNAVEAMDRGETLTIRSGESDRHIEVILKNRVPETRFKDPETLLLPFEETGKTHGLPLCYKMLRNMGGLLSCDREGDELLFTVSLPKPDEEEPSSPAGEP
jgi:PAS domain S-box-containing protein